MEIPLSIESTQKALLDGDFSCVELVDSYLKRINTFDSKINSFITVTDDSAYKKAKWVDKVIADYKEESFINYPLLGSTIAYKDLFLTEGIRTTAGSKVLGKYIPQYSATVVERLDNAGAVMLGKTNCDAWAHGTSGENSDYGPTLNPWNYDYVPGGSSSGSAAAVAANFSLVALGTDTGGSIRQPASFCGVVGYKPTYGAVSRYGVVAMASSLDSIGNLSHYCEDSRRLFNIIKGKDNKDATIKETYSDNKKDHGSIKIGIAKEYFPDNIDEDIKNTVLSAAEVFGKSGIEIQNVSLPNTEFAISTYYIIQPAEVSSNLSRYDGIRFGEKRDKFSKEAKRRIILGTHVLSSGYYDDYYIKAMKVRTKIIRDFEKVFEDVDAIIAPVSPTPAFKLNEKISDPLSMYLADVFTVPANIAGLPGLSIPYGFNKHGLPLGFQLISSSFRDDLLFSLGKIFESETNYKPNVAKLT